MPQCRTRFDGPAGTSGLGIEAQRKAVLDFLNGGNWKLAEEFVEVESGKRNNRLQLAAALAACKRIIKARRVVAKLNRLARNVAFISKLMESGVEFVAADMPFANKLTIHILAAVAEHEREAISARTKAALAAAKARGVKLGGPKLKQAQRRDVPSNKANADRFAGQRAAYHSADKGERRDVIVPLLPRRSTRAALRRLAAASGRQCK